MEYCDDGDLMQKIKHQRGKLFPEDTVRKHIFLKQGPWSCSSCKLEYIKKYFMSHKKCNRYANTLNYLKWNKMITESLSLEKISKVIYSNRQLIKGIEALLLL